MMRNVLRRFLTLMLAAVMLFVSAVGAQAATLTLPSSLKNIESQAFDGATMLDNVVLPDGITAIGSRAFANSTLTSINLPRSITSIAADAFENSPNVTAIVKSGSYAQTFCAENGIPYEVETLVLPSSGIPVSVSTTQTSVAMGEESLEFIFATDDGSTLGEDQWVNYSMVYLNAVGEVIDASNYGTRNLGTHRFWLACADAAKVIITIMAGEGVCPGANPSIEVEVTGSDTLVYYEYNIDGYGYPGGTMRASVVAMNADQMTGTQNVTITDEKGSFTKAGTLSADNPKFITEFTVPADWDFYDDEGNYQDYYVIFTVGDERLQYYVNAEPFCSDYIDVPVGGTTEFNARIVPSEMPYTYSVADTSIAVVNEYGFEGLKVGTTTGTLTTKNGIAVDFTIEVSDFSEGETEASPSEPVFYVAAAQEAVVKGDDVELFYIYSETENSLRLNESIDIVLRFYDENETLVDTIYTSHWINADDYETYWADWQWWDDMLGGAQYSFIEFAFDTSYEVIEPSTARVEVVSPEELGRLGFSMDSTNGRFSVGDTVTIPLTCTTPNLLAAEAADGAVTVKPLALYTGGLDIINNVTVASFDADTQTASVSFTVGEDAVPGEYYQIYLYCGSYQVGQYGLQIYSGLSRTAYGVNLLVGESCELPIALAEGADPANLYYDVYDPTILSIDENGVATALSAGETEIEVYYECAYGNTDNVWLNAYIYEPASDPESLPVLTVTPKAESAVFGETIPVELNLSETITDENGNPAYVSFELSTMFLDKNNDLITSNSRWCEYTADQLTGDGLTYDLKVWTSGDELYDVAYMIVVPRYNSDNGTFSLSYDNTPIPVTGLPERGEVLYSAQLNGSNSISQGSWVGIQVYRVPQSTGSDAEISICDADGNVLTTGTYWDGDYSQYVDFESNSFAAGETHTVYLYVDGEKVEGGEISFYIEEAQVYLNGLSNRMAVGGTTTLGYYYNADYDCEVTFSTSDETIASIDESNVLTALQAGTVTVTATCAHGKSNSRTLTVYDPNSDYVPEAYIFSAGENYGINWMSSVPVALGVTGDLMDIPAAYINVRTNVQLLDADGNVLYDIMEDEGWSTSFYHDLRANEITSWWGDDDVWLKAAELNASYFAFDISGFDSDEYTVDTSRCRVTVEIPPLDEYPYPVVTVDCPNIIQQGETIDVTFTCLNPSSLTRSREVRIEDYEGTTLASGYLTAETPVVTLSCDPGEDFTSGYFRYCYPMYESDTRSYSFYVTVSSYNGLGYDTKISVGNKAYMYPDYSGSYPNITVTSSDESVATAELYGSYAMSGMARDGGYVIVTGVGAGTAVITGTDTNGVSHSFTVVVYDSSNVVTPVLGIDQNQTGEVQWTDYHTLTVVAADEPHTFGRPSLNIQKEYLDADGNALLTTEVAMQTENGFFSQTETAEVYVDVATMAGLYAEGARSIRFTLTAGSYTVDESAASITLPIADPSLSEEPIIYYDMPEYSYAGGTYDVTFACMNPDKLGEGVICYAKGNADSNYASVTLTPGSSTASISITVPADRTGYSSYTTYIRIGEEGSTNYVYVDLLRGSLSGGGSVSVSGTRTLSAYLYTTVDGLTKVWASENEEIATVDQNGVVTGVAVGQTNITMTYGPLVLTVGVRVYDPNGEQVTPELYITGGDTAQTAALYSNLYVYIGTTSDLAKLGSSVSVTYEIDYLDASGAVVYRDESSYGETLDFAEGSEEVITRYVYNTMANAVAAGATQMRVSLDNTYSSYTIDPERASVVFPIQEPSDWGNNTFGFSSQAVYRGENTMHMKLVSTSSSYAETDCLITMNVTDQNGNYLLQGATATVNLATNPDAYFTFTVPESATSVSCSYTYQFGSNGTSSNNFYPKLVYVTQAQADTTVAAGSTVTASYSGNYLSVVNRSYESSNTAVATVDSDGVITGVSAGVTTITAHIGELEYSFKVRVYDESTMVQANLSLSAPETTTEWSWSGEGDLMITADQPVENLGSLTQVRIRTTFTKENGTGFSHTSSHNVSLIDSNSVVIHLASSSSYMYDAAEGGYTGVKHELYSYSGSGFTIDSEAKTVELPMQALSDYPDPMLEAGSIAYTNMVSGKNYDVAIHAVNNTVSQPVTIVGYTQISGTRYEMGSMTFTPSEAADATLTVTAPSGVTVSSFYLYIAQQNNDGTETLLSSQYCYLTPLPALTTVTTLAELQSEHNYANNINLAWAYAVEGATSLSVTFDSQTETEAASYDPLKVGSLAAFEDGSLENTYGGAIGAITVEVTGDTVVIWLKSDGSATRYGFAVTQIVATMADGSTVTITE